MFIKIHFRAFLSLKNYSFRLRVLFGELGCTLLRCFAPSVDNGQHSIFALHKVKCIETLYLYVRIKPFFTFLQKTALVEWKIEKATSQMKIDSPSRNERYALNHSINGKLFICADRLI